MAWHSHKFDKGITVSRAAAEIVLDFLDAVMGEEYELNTHGGKREGAGNPNWKTDD